MSTEVSSINHIKMCQPLYLHFQVPKIAHNALQQEYNDSAGKRQYNTVREKRFNAALARDLFLNLISFKRIFSF